jgi:hypothetical protein
VFRKYLDKVNNFLKNVFCTFSVEKLEAVDEVPREDGLGEEEEATEPQTEAR